VSVSEYAVMFVLVAIMGAGIPGPGDASLIAAGAGDRQGCGQDRREGAARRDHARRRGAVDKGRGVEVARQPPGTTGRAGPAQGWSHAGVIGACSARSRA